ncbi:hypothetical protein Ctha_2032 [Chloroherpeton thalassium ATCC 35110]|uniref:Uncharacterized protein n=1 Tax=Chloroherpeton thalassium (strain ATCC 35110 / GB-78) TaxID=517418 RepID=B3QUY3_CHLT3|nr:hypothetical protein [Chloroherpeton thalassium]ACF14484.1 hypothetical protein Ctha_2032 [Chloroherpeton thalassium ATCC 35110]
MLGFGTELRYIDTFPIRTGVRVGGRDGFAWSFGLGLDYNNFTLETSMYDASWLATSSSTKSLAFGLNMRFRFVPVPLIEVL